MTINRHAASGEVVSFFVTEEAVYLKVAVSDEFGKHLGWAKGVRIDADTLRHYQRNIERRMNEALQLELPWDDAPAEDNLRWLPPQP